MNNLVDDDTSEQKELEEQIKEQADKELEDSNDQAKEDFLRDAKGLSYRNPVGKGEH